MFSVFVVCVFFFFSNLKQKFFKPAISVYKRHTANKIKYGNLIVVLLKYSRFLPIF